MLISNESKGKVLNTPVAQRIVKTSPSSVRAGCRKSSMQCDFVCFLGSLSLACTSYFRGMLASPFDKKKVIVLGEHDKQAIYFKV